MTPPGVAGPEAASSSSDQEAGGSPLSSILQNVPQASALEPFGLFSPPSHAGEDVGACVEPTEQAVLLEELAGDLRCQRAGPNQDYDVAEGQPPDRNAELLDGQSLASGGIRTLLAIVADQ